MRGIKHFLGSLAIAGMMLASSVEAGAVGTAQSGGSSGSRVPERCRVKIIRDAAPQVFDITRAVFDNGRCICIARTGPKSQGGSAEEAIRGLLLSRSCPNAPPAATVATAGGLSTGAIIGGVLILGGGLGIALATGGSKSP